MTRQNCHPLCLRPLDVHAQRRRGELESAGCKVEALIPDAYYPSRLGTTDSEAVFLAMMGAGLDTDPLQATRRVLQALVGLVNAGHLRERLRFTSAIANGKDLYAFRVAVNDAANTLCFREDGGQAMREMLQSQLEIVTNVHVDVNDAREELRLLRREVANVAAQYGFVIMACGTHPTAVLRMSQPSPKPRYEDMIEDLRKHRSSQHDVRHARACPTAGSREAHGGDAGDAALDAAPDARAACARHLYLRRRCRRDRLGLSLPDTASQSTASFVAGGRGGRTRNRGREQWRAQRYGTDCIFASKDRPVAISELLSRIIDDIAEDADALRHRGPRQLGGIPASRLSRKRRRHQGRVRPSGRARRRRHSARASFANENVISEVGMPWGNA